MRHHASHPPPLGQELRRSAPCRMSHVCAGIPSGLLPLVGIKHDSGWQQEVVDIVASAVADDLPAARVRRRRSVRKRPRQSLRRKSDDGQEVRYATGPCSTLQRAVVPPPYDVPDNELPDDFAIPSLEDQKRFILIVVELYLWVFVGEHLDRVVEVGQTDVVAADVLIFSLVLTASRPA